MAENHSQTATGIFSAEYGSAEEIPRKLFISGHSLTNRPFPDFLAAIAGEAGHPLHWNMQYIEGSSLRMRTDGTGSPASSGYRNGTDRDRQPIDVLDELAPRDNRPPYDTLILNEVHTLLESLIWNDTIGHALDFEERFFAANPAGRTYLYSSWLNVDNLDDPTNWIAYENAAIKAWQCTAIGLNSRLAEKGRTKSVRLIPTAPALAALVKQAVSPAGLKGLSAAAPRATMERIFTDDVHLTDTGNYYIALIAYATLYGALPENPWKSTLDPVQAKALQDFARRFMTLWQKEQAKVPINCSQYLADEFAGNYLSYVRATKWRQDDGLLRAYFKWARFSFEWPRFLRGDDPKNPFRNGAQR